MSVEETVNETTLNQSSNENAAEKKRQMLNQYFDELKIAHQKGEIIEIDVIETVKGGFKTQYKELPIFLPLKRFTSKRNLTNEEIEATVGKKLKVKVIEFTEDEFGRVPKICHRTFLDEELWKGIETGSYVEGTVKNIMDFGLILDVSGIDAFVHISQLSKQRIKDIYSFAKVGDALKGTVLTVEKDRHRMTVSLKNSPNVYWEDFFEKNKVGDKISGKITSIISGGIFLEVAPNIDGFIRIGEISWTRRDINLRKMFSVGQELEVEIIELDKQNSAINLSYRNTQPNNWNEIADKYQISNEYSAVVSLIPPNNRGAVVLLNNEIDGFVPINRMKALYNGNKPTFKTGDVIQVRLIDKDDEKRSLLFESTLKPEIFNFLENSNNEFNSGINAEAAKQKAVNNYSFADLLSESSKKNLLK